MAWRLNRALTNWRAAVDRAYPNRDKASDGTIGDEAHQQTDSDHNPDPDGTVDAWDMDVDLRSGNDPAAIEALKRVFEAHPAARYWIHRGHIAHRNTGWEPQPYTGSNPHTRHVHWNSNEATEDSTTPWDLEDDMTPQELLNTRVGSPSLGDRTVADWLKGGEVAKREAAAVGQKVTGVGTQVVALAEQVTALADDVRELKARPAGTVELSDEQLERVLRRVLGMAPA